MFEIFRPLEYHDCYHYMYGKSNRDKIPLLPAVHGKEPGRGKTVVPEHGNPSGFGGDELKPGFPGIQFRGIPGPMK